MVAIPIISVLVALTLSLLITRIATVALTLTGLSRESARFQARSAFSGVGFTTAEAEQVVGHPVRRRIVMLLMLLGNAGLVTVVASIVLSFVGQEARGRGWVNFSLLMIGLALLWLLANSKWIDRRMSKAIEWALRKWTDIDIHDYESLLSLSSGFGVAQATVEPNDWMADKNLADLGLKERGILVLGIKRNGGYEGTPTGNTRLKAGDTLIVYGRGPKIKSVCGRITT